jgi:hypothetical protein
MGYEVTMMIGAVAVNPETEKKLVDGKDEYVKTGRTEYVMYKQDIINLIILY